MARVIVQWSNPALPMLVHTTSLTDGVEATANNVVELNLGTCCDPFFGQTLAQHITCPQLANMTGTIAVG